jgi:hypothetical protein
MWVSFPWKIGKARTYTIIVKFDPYDSFPESSDENNELTGKLQVTGAGGKNSGADDNQGLSSDVLGVLIAIVIVVIIMLLGIWANISIAKRGAKKGYTADGEYKPYEDDSKADFAHDDEDSEEEPEGGVLGIQSDHPYGGKKGKGDKFMKDVISITTMKPIRKTKPIKKSKPLTSLGDDTRKMGLDKPHIAGYLPPKSDSSDKNDAQNK